MTQALFATRRVKQGGRVRGPIVQTGPFGAQLHASDYVAEGVPLVLIRNIRDDMSLDTEEMPRVREEDAERLKDYRVRAGDVIVSRVGTLDRIAPVTPAEAGVLISGQTLRVRAASWNARFMAYALKTPVIQFQISQESLGSTRESISTEVLANVSLPCPPIPAQDAIAAFLDRETTHIDALISQKERLFALLEEKRQASIEWLLFSGEQPSGDGIRLRRVLEQVRLPIEVKPDQEYREIGVRSHGRGVFHKEALRGEVLGEKQVFRVIPDSLVFNIVFAWEGATAVTSSSEEGFIASHRFPMFRPVRGRCHLEFMKHFFVSGPGRKLVELHSPGSAGRNRTLDRDGLLREVVQLPPLAEQEAVVRRIQEVKEKTERFTGLLTRSITLLRERRQSLITAAVTGQLNSSAYMPPEASA